MQNLSNGLCDDKDEAGAIKGSFPSSGITVNNHKDDTSMYMYAFGFKEEIEKLEREAGMQSKQVELSDCVDFVSELFKLLVHTVIIPELQRDDDWHDDFGHQLKCNKGITGDSRLIDRVQTIAIEKGLTKEQWKQLLYINFMAGDSSEMTNVSRSHLKKVHGMVSRLLDRDEQTTVFALIDAIEKHMPESHYTEK